MSHKLQDEFVTTELFLSQKLEEKMSMQLKSNEKAFCSMLYSDIKFLIIFQAC